MDNFLTTKTVVGEAIHVNDTLILPLVDVSFGVGAGAWSQEHKNSAGGGMGGKMTPSAGACHQRRFCSYGTGQQQ